MAQATSSLNLPLDVQLEVDALTATGIPLEVSPLNYAHFFYNKLEGYEGGEDGTPLWFANVMAAQKDDDLACDWLDTYMPGLEEW